MKPTDLGEYTPTTSEEAHAASHAVHKARHWAAATALADTFTERERQLIEIAYAKGVDSIAEAVDKALGIAATTVDASAIRAALRVSHLRPMRMDPFGYDHQVLQVADKVMEWEERERRREHGEQS